MAGKPKNWGTVGRFKKSVEPPKDANAVQTKSSNLKTAVKQSKKTAPVKNMATSSTGGSAVKKQKQTAIQFESVKKQCVNKDVNNDV